MRVARVLAQRHRARQELRLLDPDDLADRVAGRHDRARRPPRPAHRRLGHAILDRRPRLGSTRSSRSPRSPATARPRVDRAGRLGVGPLGRPTLGRSSSPPRPPGGHALPRDAPARSPGPRSPATTELLAAGAGAAPAARAMSMPAVLSASRSARRSSSCRRSASRDAGGAARERATRRADARRLGGGGRRCRRGDRAAFGRLGAVPGLAAASSSTSTTRRCRRSGRRPGTPATSSSSGAGGRRPVRARVAGADAGRRRDARGARGRPSARPRERPVGRRDRRRPHRRGAVETSLITSALIERIRDDSLTVVCVSNITGRARCSPAGRAGRCPLRACDAAVGLPTRPARLSPLRTERPPVCQECGASRFANLRPGVTRLREELEAARPPGRRRHRADDAPPAAAASTSGPRRVCTASAAPTWSRSSSSTRRCWPRVSGPPSRRWR